MSTTKDEIIIIGGGLVGALLSIFMAREGFKTYVVEKRPDPRKLKISGGRSINLALSYRGIKSLNKVGIKDEVEKLCTPMHGRMMHDKSSQLSFQPYGVKGQFINSVSRKKLNELLLDKAESLGVQLFFDEKCHDVNLQTGEIILKDKKLKAKQIIGADGAFSVVRKKYFNLPRFNYSQYFLGHGYKELTIPASNKGEYQMEPGALHIWPRGNFMMIALPNKDKSFTCTLFLPFEGENAFSILEDGHDVTRFFKEHFPDSLDFLPTLTKDFFQNPTSALVTVRCYPWVYNKSVLIGDAAHAIVPFYGQGMNAGFEDCSVFTDVLKAHNFNWDDTLDCFQKSRKPDADAISELALQNFHEMSSKVMDDKFIWQKKVEAALHKHKPDQWLPLYSMVTFSDIPYSKALAVGKKQEAIMNSVLHEGGMDKSVESLDKDEIISRLNGQAQDA